MYFKLKCETKNKDFKLVMNMLYGSLCMSNVHKFQYDVTKDLTANIDLDTDRVVITNTLFVIIFLELSIVTKMVTLNIPGCA